MSATCCSLASEELKGQEIQDGDSKHRSSMVMD